MTNLLPPLTPKAQPGLALLEGSEPLPGVAQGISGPPHQLKAPAPKLAGRPPGSARVLQPYSQGIRELRSALSD